MKCLKKDYFDRINHVITLPSLYLMELNHSLEHQKSLYILYLNIKR
jgi:hypothetical protein